VSGVADEDALLAQITHSIRDEEQLTLIVGSGATGPAVPRLPGILGLADRYAKNAGDNGDLTRALEQARREAGSDAPEIEVYLGYRRVFADWVSGAGFDLVAQQAVLEAFRPTDWESSPLAAHGFWVRVDLQLGERAENAVESWQLPPGIEALGRLLVHRPDDFDSRILTTNFDPLLEIAVRLAEGVAITVPVAESGRIGLGNHAENAIRVYHLHGFWRPTAQQNGLRLLHDTNALLQPTEEAVQAVAGLISGDRVCVVGYSGWDRWVIDPLRHLSRSREVRVLWAQHGSDPGPLAAEQQRLRGQLGNAVSFFTGVDSDRLLTTLVGRLEVPAAIRSAEVRHRVRHPAWERDLVSQPDSQPPDDPLHLLRQLERRFGWGLGWAAEECGPSLLFWPIRLRQRASLIHTVQALAAGALARRGVRVVVCLDDLGVSRRNEFTPRFQDDLIRWVRHVHPAAEVDFTSLDEFVRGLDRADQGHPTVDPESLLRPAHPWAVAQEFYGRHNPSIYSVLAAMKVVPNVPLRDLDNHAGVIVQALQSKDANRLLTPLTIWALLHKLLRRAETTSIMTLGGRDERLFWDQWQAAFGLGVNQLYNPYIKSLTNESRMVRWSNVEFLTQHLTRALALPDWDKEGSYIPWLFQNAMLLPLYLTEQDPPEVGGIRLDSWASFQAAHEEGASVLAVLANFVSDLYLGPST
jgi:hypothetical protein